MIAIIPKELKSDLLLRMGRGGKCDGHTTQSGRQSFVAQLTYKLFLVKVVSLMFSSLEYGSGGSGSSRL